MSSGPEEPAEDASPTGPVDPDARKASGALARRLVAAGAAGLVVALVVCDQWAPGVRAWWGHRPFTTDVVSSLLVLAVTVLIIDEVLARRQRKDRAGSVAVQGLIVYDQALRAYESVMSGLGDKVDEAYTDEARDEVRSLAAMILVASPSLFDDPEARLFLEELQRMTGLLYRVVALVPARFVASARVEEQSAEARLKACRARLDARITPLAARLSWQDRGSLAESSERAALQHFQPQHFQPQQEDKLTVAQPKQPTTVAETRAARLLQARGVWIFPLAVASVLVMLMTLLYFGSIVDPSEHLHGLPVAVVDEDAGASTTSGRVDLGGQVTQALTHTRALTDRLAVTVVTLSQAERQMNKGGAYVTVVIPADFTASLLSLARGPGTTATPEPPTIELLANSRAGTLGVSLGEAVLEPALSDGSWDIGAHLAPEAAPDSLARALLANPVTVSVVQYRSLPSHAGLGLSAFYVSLLIMMCGFLGATIINSALDSVLGYASNEVGPRWSQRLPKRISRWQTLLAKWAVAVPGTFLFTGLMLGVSAGALGMDAPHWFELWMFGWFAAAVVAIGTLVLFAALGAPGQLIALLVFVYLALASSGGTIPLQALAGFYRFVANFEPLRQIVGAVRAILYFNGMGIAGLDRGLLLTAIGLVFWLVAGVVVTNWYDRKGLHRIHPEVLEYAYESVRKYHERDLPAASAARPDQVDLTGG